MEATERGGESHDRGAPMADGTTMTTTTRWRLDETSGGVRTAYQDDGSTGRQEGDAWRQKRDVRTATKTTMRMTMTHDVNSKWRQDSAGMTLAMTTAGTSRWDGDDDVWNATSRRWRRMERDVKTVPTTAGMRRQDGDGDGWNAISWPWRRRLECDVRTPKLLQYKTEYWTAFSPGFQYHTDYWSAFSPGRRLFSTRRSPVNIQLTLTIRVAQRILTLSLLRSSIGQLYIQSATATVALKATFESQGLFSAYWSCTAWAWFKIMLAFAETSDERIPNIFFHLLLIFCYIVFARLVT